MSDLNHPYPKPQLAVDICVMAVVDGGLRCVVMRRDDAGETGGDWALPGGFVRHGDSLEATARRVLQDKVGLSNVHIEQLATYGKADRDPRGHVVSVVYLALTTGAALGAALPNWPDLAQAQVAVDWPGEQGGVAQAKGPDDAPLRLAFDHAGILGDVVKRLRGKLDYTAIGYAFLPDLFTLRDVQDIHEAILNQKLTKPAFRRKLLDRGLIRPTGTKESGGAYRPAELYEQIAIKE